MHGVVLSGKKSWSDAGSTNQPSMLQSRQASTLNVPYPDPPKKTITTLKSIWEAHEKTLSPQQARLVLSLIL